MDQLRGEIVALSDQRLPFRAVLRQGGKTVALMEAATEAAAQAFIDGALEIWRYTKSDLN